MSTSAPSSRLALALALAAPLGCGLFTGQDVGGPRADGSWRSPAKIALRPVDEDPGVLACTEPVRHGYEGGERGSGWVDRCGWRRHQHCRDECSLLTPCHLECKDDTPPQQALDNTALYVRRLFAVAEKCPEASVSAHRTDADARTPLEAWRPPPPTTWRATGCDHRGRYHCEPGGDHASGARCERESFSSEALAEILDELTPRLAPAGAPACEPRVVGGSAQAVTLPDGRPGLALALEGCGETRAFACVRPDLVPLGERACAESVRAPGLVEAARHEALTRVSRELGCEPADADVTFAVERFRNDARELVFRARLCNATHDVRAVRCYTASLVDAALRGCWIDETESDRLPSLRELGRLLDERGAECDEDRREVAPIDSHGDGYLVRARCFGRDRAVAWYRCRNDYASGGATCTIDDETERAVALLEAGARDRLARDERCPTDKVTSQPVEGGPGRWLVRAEGCGVARDYRCGALSDRIDACAVGR